MARGVAFSKENLGDEVTRSFWRLVPSFELWARRPYHISSTQGPSPPSSLLACILRSSLLFPEDVDSSLGTGVLVRDRPALCPSYRGAPGLRKQGPGEETSRERLGDS